MIFLLISAAFVGLVHSLTPGHWLPIVLMAKTQRWPLRTALAGAVVTASGHVFISILLGIAPMMVGVHFITQSEAQIERYAGLLLAVFGVLYAIWAYTRHSKCHGHTHHGPQPPDPKNTKGKGRVSPFVFLFSLGFSPCVAVLPVFAAAAAEGTAAVLMSMVAFAAGVLFALIGATLVVSLGVMKLDHPLFEHYGDVIVGGGVTLMGLILFFFPHS